MRVLITGSSGVLGQNLTRHVTASGMSTVGVDLRGSTGVSCDVRDTARMTRLAEGCDVVVHAVGRPSVALFARHLTDRRRRDCVGSDGRTHGGGQQELDDFYASIDTFMLPSVAESFGIAQAEAIMSGIPSITTDIPGGRYPVAATGLGRLVPPRDSDALAAAMQHPHDLTREEVDSAAAWARTAFGIESFLDQHVASLNLTSTTTTTIAS